MTEYKPGQNLIKCSSCKQHFWGDKKAMKCQSCAESASDKKDPFDLDHQFDLYLTRVQLKGKKMPVDQYRELKRAYYGACGQLLVLIEDELAKLSEEEAIEKLNQMFQQVSNYWTSQKGRLN